MTVFLLLFINVVRHYFPLFLVFFFTLLFLDDLYPTTHFGVPSAAIYFDFSKAFDSVCHDIVLNKLPVYDFDHDFLLLFCGISVTNHSVFVKTRIICSLTIQTCFLLILLLYSMILILLNFDVLQMIDRSIAISAVSLF